MTRHVGAQEDGGIARQLPLEQLEPLRLVRKVFKIAVDESLCASMHCRSTNVGRVVAVYAGDVAQPLPPGYQPTAWVGSGRLSTESSFRVRSLLLQEFPVGSIKSLVLLSGPIAVGKTSVREELLAKHGYNYVRSSGYLIDLAGKQGRGEARTSLQDLGDRLDMETDYRWVLDEVARPAFAAHPDKFHWLVDAVRKRRQVEHFREAFGPRVLHVYLNAQEEVLQQRYAARLASDKDATPYDIAIRHENEVASRDLIHIADLVLDAGVASPQELAREIVVAAEQRR